MVMVATSEPPVIGRAQGLLEARAQSASTILIAELEGDGRLLALNTGMAMTTTV